MHFLDTQPHCRREFFLAGLLLAVALMGGLSNHAFAAEPLPAPAQQQPAEQLVSEIRILGNDTISASQVADQLNTRVGRPFDKRIVEGDVRRLANLGWFVDVKPLYEESNQGIVVIFQVVERPTIRYIK